MVCSICGKDNAESSLYCDDCGAALQVKTAVGVSGKEKPLEEGVLLKDKYRIIKILKDNTLRHYLAELKDLPDQKVLIEEKITSVEEAEEPYVKNPLKRQFQYLSGIINLNLQVIYDYFTVETREYLVKEHMEGTSLAEISKEKKELVTSQNVVKWAIAVCDGLAELHARKLIHRNIQPSNLFLAAVAH
ncbi:MAG: inactive serine/threonine-protein kinase VRK3, partial [Firmicutes bacterium]|nr:inactive serine/threonine-protein kinase VRK3 [Bacillota bacterium]